MSSPFGFPFGGEPTPEQKREAALQWQIENCVQGTLYYADPAKLEPVPVSGYMIVGNSYAMVYGIKDVPLLEQKRTCFYRERIVRIELEGEDRPL